MKTGSRPIKKLSNCWNMIFELNFVTNSSSINLTEFCFAFWPRRRNVRFSLKATHCARGNHFIRQPKMIFRYFLKRHSGELFFSYQNDQIFCRDELEQKQIKLTSLTLISYGKGTYVPIKPSEKWNFFWSTVNPSV